MDQRMEFMARLKAGERMTDLCAEYGISRKTGGKFAARFAAQGLDGLKDRSRRPLRVPHQTDAAVVAVLVEARQKHPTWGPHKLKTVLEAKLEARLPSPSTIGAVLKRAGLVPPRVRTRRTAPRPSALREAAGPNDLWCIDYKGQFRLGDTSYCYPLTITDQYSRLILACEGMAAIDLEAAREVCLEVFARVGVPAAIRSDNGSPFASTGLLGLTRLSALWLRVGIALERIEPGHPEQNGRHERMHRTLKAETTRPAAHGLLAQQARFDDFVAAFNTERPHQALAQRRPAEVYAPSARAFTGLPELRYPTHDDVLRVDHRGYVRFLKRDYFVTQALAGEHVGVREESDGRWSVAFAMLDLGHLDLTKKRFLSVDALPPEGT